MAGVLLYQGEVVMLAALVNKTAPQTLILRLFKNNLVPAKGDIDGSYTEATFTGYAPITLTPGSWTVVQYTPSQATYAQQTFTSTAAQTAQLLYGYYLTQTTSGTVVGAERFSDGPYTVQFLSDRVRVTPTLTQN